MVSLYPRKYRIVSLLQYKTLEEEAFSQDPALTFSFNNNFTQETTKKMLSRSAEIPQCTINIHVYILGNLIISGKENDSICLYSQTQFSKRIYSEKNHVFFIAVYC